ncbi:type II toxin-antitoxin system HigB family toxin [Dyadobacter luticola]|uniref:type II toxin-antitoxin system HigB family toxin n=1 Tax=Dyadobacter luticola TaxID=1979387 RepID=UPI001E475530|nr:type II toxin-antitoxin system HigB family toxin [Dyadobacter luticola]
MAKAIDRLIQDLENAEVDSISEIGLIRRDAEKVHNAGYYFMDIHIHRTLILIVIEERQATIVWAGNHQDYERTLKTTKRASKNG